MTDLDKVELALHRVIADNKHRPFETPIQMLQRFVDELVTVRNVPEATVAELEGPYIPEPPSDYSNAMKEGWRAFFQGRPRNLCPFPENRRDLWDGFETGWDEAELQKPEIDAQSPAFVTLPIEHPLIVATQHAAKVFWDYAQQHYDKFHATDDAEEQNDRRAKAIRNEELANALEQAIRDWCHG